jgi:hypothetical protein
MTTYTCKACQAKVESDANGVRKSCACDAPIVAHLTATVTGEGGANS